MSKDSLHSTPDTSSESSALTPLEVAEKRRRDAQAALTPLQQENARLKAELAATNTQPTTVVTPEVQAELDDLKFSDPDAWRVKMNEIDQSTTEAHTKQVDAETRRELAILEKEQFFQNNPGLNPDLVRDVIPDAIKSRYEAGEISFSQVLEIGKKLVDGAPVASVLAPSTPDMGGTSGSSTPTDTAKKKQVKQDWEKALV